MTDSLLSRRERLALGAAALGYAALLLFRYRSVPDGLVNDTAEEALRGLLLIEQRRLEVLTFVLGNSAETLWLYVLGISGKVLGPSVLAIVLPSALAAATTVVLLTLLVRAIVPDAPLPLPFLLAAGSPWLFHYGRSGLRAITAPLFVAATALLLARASRDPSGRPAFFWVGVAAGASVYGYTAGRLVPVALLCALATVWATTRERRREWLRGAGVALLGLFAVSIPNFVEMASHPREFLARGSYVAVASEAGRVRNVLATALLPFDYPARYGLIWGDDHVFDGVSAGLAGSGVNPVPLVTGLLFAGGLVWRLRRERDPASLFLAFLLSLAIVFLGPAGPSLTRLLVVLPVYVLFASLGALALARGPRARAALLGVLALFGAASILRYFARQSDPDRAARQDVAAAQTAMGERARGAAARGPVLCVVKESANVVRYLAHGTAVAVIEFYRRPFDVREVLPELPVRTILVERDPLFAPWHPPGYVESGPQDPAFRILENTASTTP